MKKSACLFAFFISVAFNIYSQSVYVGGVFPTIDHSGSISKQIDYGLYYFGAFPLLHLKQPDFRNDPTLMLLYTEQGLTYKVNSAFSLNASYVYQRENVLKDNYLNENRIHIQATFKQSVSLLNLKHRIRLDNRFIQNRITGKSPYTHRLRYLFGIDFPLKQKPSNFYFTAYEEAFFNTHTNATAIYGENWAYAALGLQLNEQHKIETGPLYTTWNNGHKTWFHQFYLQITWISHFR